MKKDKKISNASIALKATLLSIAFHLFLVEFVIFTFQPKHFLKNPGFVFLGPILEKQDFIKATSGNLQNSAEFVSIPFDSGSSMNAKLSHRKITSVAKPIFSREIKAGQKDFIKSVFLDKENKESPEISREEFAEKIGVGLTNINHKPLRLNLE